MSAIIHCLIVVAYGLFAAMAAIVPPIKLREFGVDLRITVGVALFIRAASLHSFLVKGKRDVA